VLVVVDLPVFGPSEVAKWKRVPGGTNPSFSRRIFCCSWANSFKDSVRFKVDWLMDRSVSPKIFGTPIDLKDAVDVEVLPESAEDNLLCCLGPGE
jgi:hypothetical protein